MAAPKRKPRQPARHPEPPRAAAPARRAAPRTPPGWLAYWPVAAVGVLLVGALAGIFVYARSVTAPPAPPTRDSTATVVDAVTHLDLDSTAAVGAGGVPNPLKPVRGAQPLVGAGGHPEVLYVGADYCPYCAAERWSLVVALSRFGTFSGLGLTQSSSTDIYPNTPTLTFSKATFQGSALDFEGVETQDRNQKPLQRPTAAQAQVLQAVDPGGSIPFVYIGGRQYAVGSGFLPDNLQGKTWEEVARAIQDPSTPLGRQVIGNANWITAAICQATANQGGPACSAPTIKALQAQLAS